MKVKVPHFICLDALNKEKFPELLKQIPAKTIKLVLVPTQDVRLVYGTLPLMPFRKLRQAAPFSVEDSLIDDVADLHFITSKQTKAGRFALAIVRKALLISWYEALSVQDIAPQYILPEVLALTYAPDSWHIFLYENKALIRFDPYQGVSIEIGQLSIILPLLFKENSQPKEIKISYTAEHSDYSIKNLVRPDLHLVKEETATTPEIEFAKGLAQEISVLNLLDSADFLKKIKNKTLNKNRPYGKWIKWTVLIVALFWFVTQLALISIFTYRSHQINKIMKPLFYSVFSKNVPFNSVQDRIQEKINKVYVAPSRPFLKVMLDLGAALKSHNGTVVIHQFEFKEKNNEPEGFKDIDNTLILKVTAPELRTLKKISEVLGSQQYSVDIDQVKPDANNEHITAQMTIRKMA
jgi:type II secretion system protein L